MQHQRAATEYWDRDVAGIGGLPACSTAAGLLENDRHLRFQTDATRAGA